MAITVVTAESIYTSSKENFYGCLTGRTRISNALYMKRF